jgi:hypothetical protein
MSGRDRLLQLASDGAEHGQDVRVGDAWRRKDQRGDVHTPSINEVTREWPDLPGFGAVDSDVDRAGIGGHAVLENGALKKHHCFGL